MYMDGQKPGLSELNVFYREQEREGQGRKRQKDHRERGRERETETERVRDSKNEIRQVVAYRISLGHPHSRHA